MSSAPPPSVSLRTDRRGGEVRDVAVPNPSIVLHAPRALVLLIHGYNNDIDAGRDAFEGFRARQRVVGGVEPGSPATAVPCVDVYWPGDADWGIVSFLYYPLAIGRAKDAAPVLARAIDEAVRLGGFKELHIVAHSLGCRLALELLAELRDVGGVIVRRVVFMAAAVPTFMMDAGGDRGLREAYDALVSEGGMSLFSPDDTVLRFAFPLGQTAGGPGEGVLPTALGRACWPHAGAPRTFEQHEITGAGHSDYWGWNGKTLAQADAAARHVREFLGLGTVPARTVAARPRLERSRVEPRDVAAPSRDIVGRTVEAWQTA